MLNHVEGFNTVDLLVVAGLVLSKEMRIKKENDLF
jgi:hypothetical protein